MLPEFDQHLVIYSDFNHKRTKFRYRWFNYMHFRHNFRKYKNISVERKTNYSP